MDPSKREQTASAGPSVLTMGKSPWMRSSAPSVSSLRDPILPPTAPLPIAVPADSAPPFVPTAAAAAAAATTTTTHPVIPGTVSLAAPASAPPLSALTPSAPALGNAPAAFEALPHTPAPAPNPGAPDSLPYPFPDTPHANPAPAADSGAAWTGSDTAAWNTTDAAAWNTTDAAAWNTTDAAAWSAADPAAWGGADVPPRDSAPYGADTTAVWSGTDGAGWGGADSAAWGIGSITSAAAVPHGPRVPDDVDEVGSVGGSVDVQPHIPVALWRLSEELAVQQQQLHLRMERASAAASGAGDGSEGRAGRGGRASSGGRVHARLVNLRTLVDKEQLDRTREQLRRRTVLRDMMQQAADDENRRTSGSLTKIGLFALPLVHLLEFWYFHDQIKQWKDTDYVVRRNIRFAAVVCIVWIVLFVVWLIVFHVFRESFPTAFIVRNTRPALTLI